MNKEIDEMHTCSLEMKGGLESDIKYPANYMHAPKSQFPKRPPKAKELSASEIMKATIC